MVGCLDETMLSSDLSSLSDDDNTLSFGFGWEHLLSGGTKEGTVKNSDLGTYMKL